MHPEVNPFLLYEPMDAESFKPIMEDLIDRGVKYVYINDEGKTAGMFKLVPLTFRTDHIAYLGGLAVHPDFNGRGYGRHLIQEVLLLAKRVGFRRIELSVASINEKALKLYERAGFEREGVLRKYTHLKKEDTFLDEIMMSCLL